MNHFQSLPAEILIMILSYLNPQELHAVKSLNRVFAGATKACISYNHRGKFNYLGDTCALPLKEFFGMLSNMPPRSLVFPRKITRVVFVENFREYDLLHMNGKKICIQDYLETTRNGNVRFAESIFSDIAKIQSFAEEKDCYMEIKGLVSENYHPEPLTLEIFLPFVKIVSYCLNVRKILMPNVLLHQSFAFIDYLI